MRNLELLFVGERTEIWHILHQGDTSESSNTGKQYKINFSFNCNSINVVYLLTCKTCEKQYVGSTVSKFRSRFNQYKSNINLHGEGQRGFTQETLIEHFFWNKHNGSHKDIKVQIIDYCNPNPERRDNFWIYHLDSIYPRGLNTRKLVLWFWLLFDDLCFKILISSSCLGN